MFTDVQKLAKKAGQAPGTLSYTGTKKNKLSTISIINFDPNACKVSVGNNIDTLLIEEKTAGMTWINVQGLSDASLIKKLAERFTIHPLTVEDIVNVEQRPKVEEFDNYLFVTLKVLDWRNKTLDFSVEQVGIVLGKNYLLSFLETDMTIFDPIIAKLQTTGTQRLRQQNVDYLAYRLIDAIVDEYFVVLEGLGEQIELVEEKIIASPTPQNARTIYRLKRSAMVLRKAVWPMREAISHLLYAEESLITKFTRVYLRDVYDHTMQAIDTIENFRDMLSSMVDMYLSGLTIRMNEIMKTLTIITTIFIPITALASIYGMNLLDVPLMKSHWGFIFVAGMMAFSVACMIVYFKKKKWI